MNEKFKIDIVDDAFIIKMADLHKLGKTNPGKELKLNEHFFSPDDLELLV